MSANQGRNNELQRKLAVLKKKSLDVKFDLENTEYSPIENIGIGAYGVVCSAVHKKTKDRVAIKKIPRIFDCEKIATTTYREIKILKHFKHDNIISIRDILKPRENVDEFRDIYVVFDLMESDLHKIIYSGQKLTEEHVRYFLYQLLRGLKYIHSANVIHRDLKPSNLLVNEDCLLRIGDFGMARGLSSAPDEPNHFMTQYVATRWYRAPEIMLSLLEYGTAVDMWSVGCIFAEMLGKKHLFPGRDYINQIKLIVGVLGSPSDTLLDMCQSDIIKKFITRLGKKEPIAWPTLFPKASRKAINVISKMLVLNPEHRMTVDQALKHPYLSKYHDPDDEPICVPAFNFDFENEEMNKAKLRKLIFKEITEYQEPRTPTLSFNAFLKPVPKDGSCSVATKPGETTTQGLTTLQTTIQGLQVVPNQGTEGFKKPLEVKKEEPELTINELPVPSTDIEMLSARSEDGIKTAPVLKKSIETSQKKDNKKGETISSDTKALVKAALLNSSLKKQRSESLGDGDDRPKPVTAAQRQKERENKRKKKKEKAIERMKKSKEKQGNQAKKDLLTDEDRELLQRWSKMQKANQPIAPKPDCKKESVKQVVNATVTSISDTGQTPGQQCLQQYLANQLQKKQHKDTQNQDVPKVGQNIAGQNIGASNLVLPKGQGNSDTSGFENVRCDQPQTNHSSVSSSHGAIEGLRNATNQTESEQSNMNLSTINFESLKMLGLVSSQNSNANSSFQSGAFFSSQQSLPFSAANTDPLISDENQTMSFSQDFRVVSHGSPSSQQGSPQKEYSNHSSPESYQSAGSPEYYQPSEQGRLSVTDTSDHQQRSPQSVFDQQTNSPQSVFDNQGSSPQPPVYQPQGSPQGATFSQYDHQRRSSDEHSQNFGQFDRRPSGEGPSQSQTSQQDYMNFERRTSDEQLSNQTAQNTMLSLNTVQDLRQHINQMPYAPVLLNSDRTSFQGQFFSQSNPNEIPFKPHGILHNTELSSHDPTLFPQDVRFPRVSAVAGSSDQLSFQTNTPPDLIASLSRQLSRQQVEDPGPPALALTPRGTGAGYGVGMDLDALMMDAQEVTHTRPEPSPLSSSLLTDWMEVTGDLNIDIEALEQELSLQSPMTLSYNDLSMYPS